MEVEECGDWAWATSGDKKMVCGVGEIRSDSRNPQYSGCMITIFFSTCVRQASEEASLRALESLMTEFFHNCTTNERKREIGKLTYLPPLSQLQGQ